MKKTVGIVFGGKPEEYEISLMSAANVLRAMNSDKYGIVKLGMSREGKWFITDASIEDIENGKWIDDASNRECSIPHDPTVSGVATIENDGSVNIIKIDCMIPVLHGDHGEDGEIQGLFQLAEIPYVGSGVKSSANCMDKTAAKQIAKLTGVRMADHYVVRIADYKKDAAVEVKNAIDTLGSKFPMFVKPSSAGSSVGVSKVDSKKELSPAIEEALKYDHKVLVEECIIGREMEVAVLGNLQPKASPVGEINAAADFYDYESKYINPEIQTSIVEDLSTEEIDEIRDYAVKLYKELDCRGRIS